MSTSPPPRSKNVQIDMDDDGLPCPLIKPHTREKLYTLGYLMEEFTGAMHRKFPNLVYVDLFAGAGRNRFESGALIEGSPLIAARTSPPFTKLVLVEENPDNLSALKERFRRDYPSREIAFLQGNCNVIVEQIMAEIPRARPNSGVLCFCFVDPFGLGIHSSTMRRLSDVWIDFLVLIADQMAGERDPTLHDPENRVVELFLDDINWREKWKTAKSAGMSFRDFLYSEFTARMASMDFKEGTPKRVRVAGMETKLYRLAFYSRKDLGVTFWESARKRGSPQGSLF